MLTVIGERVINVIPLIIPLILVIDFIYDLIRWIFFKDEFWHVFHDFLRVFVIGAVIYFCSNYMYAMLDIDYGIVPRLIMNRAPLNSYEYPSDEIKEISELIKEEYDINVYVDVDVEDVYGDIVGQEFEYGTSEEKALEVLNRVYSALEKYNSSTLKKMPENFFVVNSIGNYSGLNSSIGYIFHKKDFIVLYADAKEETVDHEIMHSLDIYLPIKDEAYMFDHFKEGCALISNYACTNRSEFLSETWERSFDMLNDNEYYDVIRKSYDCFLKEFSDEYYVSTYNLHEINERYNALNERGKNVYDALYSVKEGESYVVEASDNEIRDAIEVFRGENPECIYFDKIHVYGNGNECTVYLSENFSQDYEEEKETLLSEIRKRISELDGMNDYDKLLHIYTDIMVNVFKEPDYDDAYSVFLKNNYDELLRIYCKELGYYSISNTLIKDEKYIVRAVKVEINGEYYWLAPRNEYSNARSPRFFLVNDDFMRKDGIEIPDFE